MPLVVQSRRSVRTHRRSRQPAGERGASTTSPRGARARLVLGRDAESAFFATLVLRLTPLPSWEIDTIATDGRALQYHPPFVTGLSPDELVGVLAHEVMHCALAHPARRGSRDATRWNIACDLAINPLLLKAGVVLPLSRLMPGEGSYVGLDDGKSADEYYAALPSPEQTQDGGDEGSQSTRDPGGCGQVVDPGNGDVAESRQIEAEWQVAVSQAQSAAAGRGPLPAGLGRAVQAVLHPAADWREVLRAFVSSQARNDYSWVRPNRRFIAQGLYLPGLYSEELGDVVLAVDTSGSIGAQLARAVRGRGQCRPGCFACSLTVLYHDTEVQKVQTWKSTDGPLVLDPVGGGGTNHVCVFDWIERSGLSPACVVCLTDLETEFPIVIPTIPVLWAVTGALTANPPFGQVVSLST